MPKRRSVIQDLNPKAEEYVEARLDGKSAAESAAYAGYAPRTAVETLPVVREGLSKGRAELAANHGVTRGASSRRCRTLCVSPEPLTTHRV